MAINVTDRQRHPRRYVLYYASRGGHWNCKTGHWQTGV